MKQKRVIERESEWKMFHCDSLAKRIKWFTFPFAIYDSLSAFLFPAFCGSSEAAPVLRTWFPRVSSPNNVAKAYKNLPKPTGCFIATLESEHFSFASFLYRFLVNHSAS